MDDKHLIIKFLVLFKGGLIKLEFILEKIYLHDMRRLDKKVSMWC